MRAIEITVTDRKKKKKELKMVKIPVLMAAMRANPL